MGNGLYRLIEKTDGEKTVNLLGHDITIKLIPYPIAQRVKMLSLKLMNYEEHQKKVRKLKAWRKLNIPSDSGFAQCKFLAGNKLDRESRNHEAISAMTRIIIATSK